MNSIPGVDGSEPIEKALAVYLLPSASTPVIIINIPGSNCTGLPSLGMNLTISTSGVSSVFSERTYSLSVIGMGVSAITAPYYMVELIT